MKKIRISKYFIFFLVLLLIFGFILAYLAMTDYIESNKLYPKGENFYFIPWTSSVEERCIDVSTYPASIFYFDSPATFIYPNESITFPGYIQYYLTLNIKCNFTTTHIIISGTNLSAPILYTISGSDNNTQYSFTNTSYLNNYSLYNIPLAYDPKIRIYSVMMSIPLNNPYYKIYTFSQGASANTLYRELGFYFRKDWKSGYYADENSFSISEGTIKREDPVMEGNYKHYEFNSTSSIVLKFSPKNKFWVLVQKASETIVLGLVAVLIYDLFKIPFIKKIKIKLTKVEIEIY